MSNKRKSNLDNLLGNRTVEGLDELKLQAQQSQKKNVTRTSPPAFEKARLSIQTNKEYVEAITSMVGYNGIKSVREAFDHVVKFYIKHKDMK